VGSTLCERGVVHLLYMWCTGITSHMLMSLRVGAHVHVCMRERERERFTRHHCSGTWGTVRRSTESSSRLGSHFDPTGSGDSKLHEGSNICALYIFLMHYKFQMVNQ
jgi:hypothetical protein